MPQTPTARLIEIFESFQGEGPYVGIPMVFVRFQDCALSCRYCDTPDSFRSLPEFRLETPPASGRFHQQPNPIGISALSELLASFSKAGACNRFALTGGEPLQHAEFLTHWLPYFRKDYLRSFQKEPWILLETNGVLADEFHKVRDQVDVVSMDLKLPSVTGMRDYWEEHERFLQEATQLKPAQELYVKLVIGEETLKEEIIQGLELLKKYHPQLAVILQPVTPRNKSEKSLNSEKLWIYFQVAQAIFPQVRVIPQLHPYLGIL